MDYKLIKETDYPEKEINQKIKLFPCPFCGSKEVIGRQESCFSCHVCCLTCGIRTRPFSLPAENPKLKPFSELWLELTRYAAEDWNKRTKKKETKNA